MARPTNEELARRRAAAEAQGQDAVQPAPADVTPDPVLASSALGIEEDRERIRAMRSKQPFGAFDKKLDLAPIMGYKQHWFNDKPGRVERALGAGWTYVLDDQGKPKSMVVDGNGLRAFALKIPEEFWLEDVKRSDAKAKAQLDAVKKKPSQTGQPLASQDQGAFYTPHASGEAADTVRERR